MLLNQGGCYWFVKALPHLMCEVFSHIAGMIALLSNYEPQYETVRNPP